MPDSDRANVTTFMAFVGLVIVLVTTALQCEANQRRANEYLERAARCEGPEKPHAD